MLVAIPKEVVQLSDLASTLEQLTYDAGRVADSLVAQQLTGVRKAQGGAARGWARASRVWQPPDMQALQLFCKALTHGLACVAAISVSLARL